MPLTFGSFSAFECGTISVGAGIGGLGCVTWVGYCGFGDGVGGGDGGCVWAGVTSTGCGALGSVKGGWCGSDGGDVWSFGIWKISLIRSSKSFWSMGGWAGAGSSSHRIPFTMKLIIAINWHTRKIRSILCLKINTSSNKLKILSKHHRSRTQQALRFKFKFWFHRMCGRATLLYSRLLKNPKSNRNK